MNWSNCDGKWWEEFTPCDADHMGICENLLGNLICSKNLDQLYTGGHFLFLKGRPKISTLLLISWPWSSGPSCWEQDHQSHPPLFTFTNPSPALLVLHSTPGKVVSDIKNQRMNSIWTCNHLSIYLGVRMGCTKLLQHDQTLLGIWLPHIYIIYRPS